ncbi:MAG: hypothetical protein HY537_09995 [Deltaproteobacteria bacterium]|nr:hypothetical protein [Deltaproteobacteria bacterium]
MPSRAHFLAFALTFSVLCPAQQPGHKALPKEDSDITRFLMGTKDASGQVLESKKGMGFENPSLVKLLSLAYGTLQSCELRMKEANQAVKKYSGDPSQKNLLEAWRLRLYRTRVQYRLTWELLRKLIEQTIGKFEVKASGNSTFTPGKFDLRWLKHAPQTKNYFGTEPVDGAEKVNRDTAIKKEVLKNAGELFLAVLKFQSLKQAPVRVQKSELKRADKDHVDLLPSDVDSSTFAWLDNPEFALSSDEAGDKFLEFPFFNGTEQDLKANPELSKNALVLYKNIKIQERAQKIVQGFSDLLNKQQGGAFRNIDLDMPTTSQQVALAEQVLKEGKETLKAEPGLVLLYMRVLGALIEPYNVNTHDSFEIMRGALLTMFRHVLDLPGQKGWTLDQVKHFRPFAHEPKDSQMDAHPAARTYEPLARTLKSATDGAWANYWNEVQTGPKLLNQEENEEALRQEYLQYHGDILKDLFGRDVTHWVWPTRLAWKGHASALDPKQDRRLQFSVGRIALDENGKPKVNEEGVPFILVDSRGNKLPEGRKEDGISARDELAHLESGWIYMEKGTGLGSDGISLATVQADPASRLKEYIDKPSSPMGMITDKGYSAWAKAMGWIEDNVFEKGDQLPEWLKPTDMPGRFVDYRGTSHAGIVEVFGDSRYPQLQRADFVDAFPDLMRQAWRRHACGHAHSRLCMFLRMRKSWALDYVKNFEQTKLTLDRQLKRLAQKVRAPFTVVVDDVLSNTYSHCKYLLTDYLAKVAKDGGGEGAIMGDEFRAAMRPAYEYCNAVFLRKGMEFFEARVMSDPRSRTGSWDGDELVRVIGALSVEKARNMRNQLGEEKGLGQEFDSTFDNFTKHRLYCSEKVELAYRLIGMDIYPRSFFKDAMKLPMRYLSDHWISKLTDGFERVPYTAEDDVYAPHDIILQAKGRLIWEVVGEMRRAYFGVNDE